MKKLYFLFLFSVLIFFYNNNFAQYSGNCQITNVSHEYNGESIAISYEIVNYKNKDKFNIWIEAYNGLDKQIPVKSVKGDIGKVTGGTHIITWNFKEDGVSLNDNIYIKVNGYLLPNISTPEAMGLSVLFPGLGDYKLQHKKSFFLFGLLGYGLVASALTFNNMAIASTNKYNSATTNSDAAGFLKNATSQRMLSYAFAAGAAVVWTFDLASLFYKKNDYKRLTPVQIQDKYNYQLLTAKSEKKQLNSNNQKFERDSYPPSLFAELSFYDDNGNGILEALENSRINIKLINQGKGKAQGLRITVTDDLNDKNLVIGSKFINLIAPESFENIAIPIKAEKGVKTAKHKLNIKVSEFFGYDMDDASLLLNTFTYQSPKLSCAGLEILDKGDKTMAVVEDGAIQQGEQVRIKVLIQNIGYGIARNVKVSVVTSNNDIYLADNNGSLGNIQAGEVKEFFFTLSPNKKVTEKKLPVSISVTEQLDEGNIKDLPLALELNSKPPKTNIITVKSDFESLKKNIAKFEYTSSKFTMKTGTVFNIREVEEKAKKKKNTVGVIFGIENYKELAPAPYAANDAAIMKEYFEKMLGLEQVVIYTNEQVIGLIFDDVFNPEIGELQKAVVKGESEVYVFYSGHGVPDKTGENIYLFPSDGKIPRLETQGYNINKLYESLNKLGAKSVTVFLDACFTGVSRVSETYKAENLTSTKGVKIKAKLLQPWITNANFSVFTSSSGDETSLGYDASSTGLFTYFLCAGMQGKADINNDKKITLGELKNYVIENVTTTSKKISGLQTPEFHGNENIVVVEL